MFEQLYEQLRSESIFKPKSMEEVIQEILSQANATKNEDGSYDATGNVELDGLGLTKIPVKFRYVDKSFYCEYNNLISLEGVPKEVGEHFWCSHNKLTSLKGVPIKVGGFFNCSHNNLTSLRGVPKEVGERFDCGHNELTSLEGAPVKINGYFVCSNNNLTSLEGAPKEVSGFFSCIGNKLTSLEGVGEVKGEIHCQGNPVSEDKLLKTIGR